MPKDLLLFPLFGGDFLLQLTQTNPQDNPRGAARFLSFAFPYSSKFSPYFFVS